MDRARHVAQRIAAIHDGRERARLEHLALRIVSVALLAFFLTACDSQIPARLETVNGRQIEVYGASDLPETPRDPRTIVEELRVLLDAQAYAPPYLLVGHSNGGGYMELFAKSHPDEVAGVVLVDPRHRDFLTACTAAALAPIDCGIPDSKLSQQSPTVIAEYLAYSMASDQMRAAGTFGAYPVRVLTAMDGSRTAARQALWRSMHASLAAEAADGAQILVDGSTHDMTSDRPDVIVDTILSLVP